MGEIHFQRKQKGGLSLNNYLWCDVVCTLLKCPLKKENHMKLHLSLHPLGPEEVGLTL